MILNFLTFCVNMAIVIKLSPVESFNKKLTQTEKQIYKYCVVVVAIWECIIGIIVLINHLDEVFYVELIALIIQMISVMIGLYWRKEYLKSMEVTKERGV